MSSYRFDQSNPGILASSAREAARVFKGLSGLLKVEVKPTLIDCLISSADAVEREWSQNVVNRLSFTHKPFERTKFGLEQSKYIKPEEFAADILRQMAKAYPMSGNMFFTRFEVDPKTGQFHPSRLEECITGAIEAAVTQERHIIWLQEDEKVRESALTQAVAAANAYVANFKQTVLVGTGSGNSIPHYPIDPVQLGHRFLDYARAYHEDRKALEAKVNQVEVATGKPERYIVHPDDKPLDISLMSKHGRLAGIQESISVLARSRENARNEISSPRYVTLTDQVLSDQIAKLEALYQELLKSS